MHYILAYVFLRCFYWCGDTSTVFSSESQAHVLSPHLDGPLIILHDIDRTDLKSGHDESVDLAEKHCLLRHLCHGF